MGNEGLGGLAKRWLTSKVKELTTTDRHVRDAAEYEAQEANRQLRNEAAGEALMTAIPGLRRLRDRQAEMAAAAERAGEREVADELSARPWARLRLSVTGAVTGDWSGPIPAAVVVVEPDWSVGGDPYGAEATLVVDLRLAGEADAHIGGEPFSGWSFEVPGFTGVGAYDLAASGMARRQFDCEPDYLDWELSLGGDGGAFYFQPDAGASRVEVATATDGTMALTVAMSLVGSAGNLRASAEIVVPAPEDVS